MQNGKNTVLHVYINTLIGLKLGRFFPLVHMFLTKRANSVLSISGCAGSLRCCAGFSLVSMRRWGATSSCYAKACGGPSPCPAGAPGHRPQQLQFVGSVVALPGLQRTSSIVAAQGPCRSVVCASSWIRDPIHASCIGRQTPHHWVTREGLQFYSDVLF